MAGWSTLVMLKLLVLASLFLAILLVALFVLVVTTTLLVLQFLGELLAMLVDTLLFESIVTSVFQLSEEITEIQVCGRINMPFSSPHTRT